MRSLNKVTLIGNATKDPELRYTPQGTAVCTFSVATNREWTDSAGQKKEEATFHRIVVWSKLAEIISQYLKKSSKVYLEGRISNRQWKDPQGETHYATEIVADEIILLDNRKTDQADESAVEAPPEPEPVPVPEPTEEVKPKTEDKVVKPVKEEEVNEEDIPF
jgi:single-strand DNA-binding protein